MASSKDPVLLPIAQTSAQVSPGRDRHHPYHHPHEGRRRMPGSGCAPWPVQDLEAAEEAALGFCLPLTSAGNQQVAGAGTGTCKTPNGVCLGAPRLGCWRAMSRPGACYGMPLPTAPPAWAMPACIWHGAWGHNARVPDGEGQSSRVILGEHAGTILFNMYNIRSEGRTGLASLGMAAQDLGNPSCLLPVCRGASSLHPTGTKEAAKTSTRVRAMDRRAGAGTARTPVSHIATPPTPATPVRCH